MKISIFGVGYVGLTTGACLANLGHQVLCVDISEERIKMLQNGKIPFYEPGLAPLVKSNVQKGRLTFSTNLIEAVKFSEVIFNCVGTPSNPDGSAKLDYVYNVADTIAENMNSYKVIVVKSTVPPGTARKVAQIVGQNSKDFDVVSNPEFLREGNAIRAFNYPDKIVIGATTDKAFAIMRKVYSGRLRMYLPIVETDWETAEVIKYANNTFLSTKISFINEMANICDHLNADVKKVSMALGMDYRIAPRFLSPGVGYGGSCLLGNEQVILKHNKKIRVMSMENFHKLYTKKERLEILSFDGKKKKVVFKRVIGSSRRKYIGDVYTITTRMNKKIQCTDDHPFIVYEDNSFKTKLAKELSLSDYLPSFLSFPFDSKDTEKIDVISILKEPQFDYSKVRVRPKNSSFETYKTILSKRFKAGRLRDIIRSNCMNLKEFLQVENSLDLHRKDLLLFTAKGNATYCPAILDWNSNFCTLIGYYLSEGHVHYEKGKRGIRARIGFHFHQKEKEFINEVKEILDQLSIRYSISHQINNSTTSIITSSRILAFVIDQYLGCGRNCYEADVPDTIFSLSKELKLAFLSALFRGDGHVSFPKNTNSVVFDYGSISNKLVQKMILLLHTINVVPSYKTSRSSKSTDFAHFIRISTKEQIKRLKFFKDLPTQVKINKVLQKCKDIKPVGFKRINKDFCVTSVKSLEKEHMETDVFSLEVADTETFVTTGGLIIHNCFPKDVRALVSCAQKSGYDAKLFAEVNALNERQKLRIVEKIKQAYGNDISGKTFAILGLSFKPKTSDMREAPSTYIIPELIKLGAKIRVHDPVAMEEAKPIFNSSVVYCNNLDDTVTNSHALVLVTEWDEFRNLDLSKLKSKMQGAKFFDGRNVYEPESVKEEGFEYFGMGRK